MSNLATTFLVFVKGVDSSYQLLADDIYRFCISTESSNEHLGQDELMY